MTDQQSAEMRPVEGGVTAARGFRASGVHAGFRKDPERFDLALVAADEPCACAAVFTQNVFCSAPVTVSREHLEASATARRARWPCRASTSRRRLRHGARGGGELGQRERGNG
uniref:bifunctional ornithine acetyltransferase/N-acetylglutamate synthase n=1 Tax=Eggerthella sinensis TaxID=242230 RepID=UPI0022E4453F